MPLSNEYLITNTLHAFLMALVLMQVGGWMNFAMSAFPGSCLLFTRSAFSNPSAVSYAGACCRKEEGPFFCLSKRQGSSLLHLVGYLSQPA